MDDDAKIKKVQKRAKGMGVFKVVDKVMSRRDAVVASTTMDYLEPLQKAHDARLKPIEGQGANNKTAAAIWWAPWVSEYEELCDGGMKKSAARNEIVDKIQKEGTWPPPYKSRDGNNFPSEKTLKNRLK